MDEFDFEEALSGGNVRKLAAPGFLGALKDFAVEEARPVLKRAPEMTSALAGTALLGILAHHHMKPGKGGALSKEQVRAAEGLAKTEDLKKRLQAEGRDPSYGESMDMATAPAKKEIADTVAKHPVKGALHFARQPATIAAGSVLGMAGLHGARKLHRAGKQVLGKMASAEKTAVLDMSSMIPSAQGLLGRMAPAAGRLMNVAKANPAGAGAVAGGALGAARGLLSNPGIDPRTGQQKSRLGAAVRQGAVGAAAGGAIGHLAATHGGWNPQMAQSRAAASTAAQSPVVAQRSGGLPAGYQQAAAREGRAVPFNVQRAQAAAPAGMDEAAAAELANQVPRRMQRPEVVKAAGLMMERTNAR